MKPLRIFISSPGDVEEEREKTRQVVEVLRRHYGPGADLRIVMWEDLALDIDLSAQQSIENELVPEEKVPDIAVFILWSRLGSELSEEKTPRPDGGVYRSGTEHEFELMLRARAASGGGKPQILAYWRDDDESFVEGLKALGSDKYAEAVRQRDLARQFVREQFMDERGRNVRGLVIYPDPVSFAQRLHSHLRQTLDRLLGRESAAGGDWDGVPYLGLKVFESTQAAIFHGREEETCEILQRLRDQREAGRPAFVAMVGASGAGKSSLARAGAAATLERFSFDETVKVWRTVLFLPSLHGAELFGGLVRQLAEAVPELGSGGASLEDVAASLAKHPGDAVKLALAPAFVRAGEFLGGPLRLLLLLDQMEELWTDRRIGEERERFLEAVEALAATPHVAVLATLRADFYGEAQGSPAFLRLKEGRGHADVPAPGPAALQRIIAEPARLAGLTFERGGEGERPLDEVILEDAAKDLGALPLLQDALLELYERRDEPRRLLTYAAYEAMGGVEGALGKRANETFAALDEEAAAALEELLPLLVSVDGAGDQNAVRRRAPLAELTATPARRALCEALIEARFLTTDREGTDQTPVAALAHEALLLRWDRLKEWTDRNHDLLRLRASVEQGERRWREAGRERSLLLPAGLPLEEGRRLLREGGHLLDGATWEYVERSIADREAEEARRASVRTTVMGAMTVLTLVALGAGAWAWKKQREAETAEAATVAQLAETQKQLERSQLEEGRAWLERARLAWEGDSDPFTAIMFAGRSVGFHGFGRRVQETAEFEEEFPGLLGHPMRDSENEKARLREIESVRAFTETLPSNILPIWSIPLQTRPEKGTNGANPGNSARRFRPVVVFSPDGTRVACSIDRMEVAIWDLATGTELLRLRGHTDDVTGIAFHPDGTRLASASLDKTARIWDVGNGAEIATLEKQLGPVTCVAYSPDGTLLAIGTGMEDAADHSGWVSIWDSTRLFGIYPFNGETSFEGTVKSIEFSPDSKQIAAIQDIGTLSDMIIIRDVKTGKRLPVSSTTQCFSYSPDGKRMALTSLRRADILNASDLRTTESISLQKNDLINSISFTKDGSTLAIGTGTGKISFWKFTEKKFGVKFQFSDEAIECISFSHDGSKLAFATSTRLNLWSFQASRNIVQCGLNGTEVALLKGELTASISPNYNAGGSITAARIWDHHTTRAISRFTRNPSYKLGGTYSVGGVSIATNPEGVYIGTSSNTLVPSGVTPEIDIWNRATGVKFHSFPGVDANIRFAFCPDNRSIALGGLNGRTIEIFDYFERQKISAIHGQFRLLNSIEFLPDGGRVATISDYFSNSGKLQIWAPNDRGDFDLEHGIDSVRSIAFSNNGSLIAIGKRDGSIDLLDSSTYQAIRLLEHRSSPVSGLAFSDDRNLLGAGYESGQVRVWNVNSGRCLASFNEHSELVNRLSFNEDGSVLASASHDGTVRYWNLRQSRDSVSSQSGHSPFGDDLSRPDLRCYLDLGWFRFESRRLVANEGGSAESVFALGPLHSRGDELAGLTSTDLPPAEEAGLRLRRMARTGQWRAARAWWNREGKSTAPGLRRDYLVLMTSCASDPLAAAVSGSLDLICGEVVANLHPEAFDDRNLALSLGEYFLFLSVEEPARLESFLAAALTIAPPSWVETCAERAANLHRSMGKNDVSKHRLTNAVETLAAFRSESPKLVQLHSELRSSEDSAPEASEDRLLAHPGATAKDFIDSANAATNRNDPARAVDLLTEAKIRFGDDASIDLAAGWCHLRVNDSTAATRSFENASRLLKPGEQPGTDLLAGLAIARWLTGKRDDAVATYRQLVKTGRTQETPEDWADPKTIADLTQPDAQKIHLEALRAETLKRHPELTQVEHF